MCIRDRTIGIMIILIMIISITWVTVDIPARILVIREIIIIIISVIISIIIIRTVSYTHLFRFW